MPTTHAFLTNEPRARAFLRVGSKRADRAPASVCRRRFTTSTSRGVDRMQIVFASTLLRAARPRSAWAIRSRHFVVSSSRITARRSFVSESVNKEFSNPRVGFHGSGSPRADVSSACRRNSGTAPATAERTAGATCNRNTTYVKRLKKKAADDGATSGEGRTRCELTTPVNYRLSITF